MPRATVSPSARCATGSSGGRSRTRRRRHTSASSPPSRSLPRGRRVCLHRRAPSPAISKAWQAPNLRNCVLPHQKGGGKAAVFAVSFIKDYAPKIVKRHGLLPPRWGKKQKLRLGSCQVLVLQMRGTRGVRGRFLGDRIPPKHEFPQQNQCPVKILILLAQSHPIMPPVCF